MDAQATETTPERAGGVTEDWLVGLETPGGIHGGGPTRGSAAAAGRSGSRAEM